MKGNETSLSFRQMLDACSDPGSSHYHEAWREFMNRYKSLIYGQVQMQVHRWNIPRLGLQRNETVDDIVSDVCRRLYQHNCRALRNYRERDNENKFKSWLATTARRAAIGHLSRNYRRCLIEEEIENLAGTFAPLRAEVRSEIYEYVVQELRDAPKNNTRTLERNINIFTLYIMAEFSKPMIFAHPCLGGTGDRVIDNLINRMRKSLREGKTEII